MAPCHVVRYRDCPKHGRNSPARANDECLACRGEAARARRAERRAYTDAIKLTHGCERCGYNRCAEALHFHHRDPRQKRMEVQRAARSGWSTMVAEIAKCDVLCANCHAETHAAERQARPAKPSHRRRPRYVRQIVAPDSSV